MVGEGATRSLQEVLGDHVSAETGMIMDELRKIFYETDYAVASPFNRPKFSRFCI